MKGSSMEKVWTKEEWNKTFITNIGHAKRIFKVMHEVANDSELLVNNLAAVVFKNAVESLSKLPSLFICKLEEVNPEYYEKYDPYNPDVLISVAYDLLGERDAIDISSAMNIMEIKLRTVYSTTEELVASMDSIFGSKSDEQQD